MEDAGDTRPILIVPYMWIGDFVRGHTVVRVLKARCLATASRLRGRSMRTAARTPGIYSTSGAQSGVVSRSTGRFGQRWFNTRTTVWPRTKSPIHI